MKILYLSQSFPPEPGATARPLKQAVSLQRLGHDVTVVTSMPFYPFGRIYPGYRWKLVQRESVDGVRVFRIWSFPAPNVGVVRRLLSYGSFAAFSILAGLYQPQPELVIASVPNPGTDFAGLVIAWLRSARCIVEFRDFVAESLAPVGHAPDGLLVSIAAMYQRMVCRLADFIAVPNKSMVDLLCHRGVPPERVLYLPHAADAMPPAEPQIIDTIRNAMVEGDWFLALYAGSFGRYYRLDTLVQAARIISRREERVKLVLLGTGTERARIEQIIQSEGLTTLGLAGPVAPDAVAPYLQAANLLIAPLSLTNQEPGSGFLYTKDCQYLLAGKPIIAVEPRPRLKLILEAIDAGTGVALDDAEGLVEALLWYANHPEEAVRHGRNGREYAERHLMRDDIVRTFDRELRLRLQLPAARRQMPWHKRLLMRVNAWIRKHVFSKPRFARWIFGVRVTAPPALQSYWEWPTLWQRIIVGRYLRDDSRVLEVGTGAHAILATYIKRNWPDADVLATDILPDRVESARRTIDANQIVVGCIQSDLFSKVDGQYDLILSNLPQTCTSDLAAMGYHPRPETGLGAPLCWSSDGGEDGMAVIHPFLKACPRYLRRGGRLLMAISPTHVDRSRLHDEILQAGMRIERVHRLPFVNSIYALIPAGRP
jgi:putative colanic acid biosynthesis glycosyltransferase WcaI